MKLTIQLSEYIASLKGYSNAPLTLDRLTSPFGIASNRSESDTLLVGHVLDTLVELGPNSALEHSIDCIDVATAAFELGHEEAGPFLDEAPYIMYRMLRVAGIRQAPTNSLS